MNIEYSEDNITIKYEHEDANVPIEEKRLQLLQLLEANKNIHINVGHDVLMDMLTLQLFASFILELKQKNYSIRWEVYPDSFVNFVATVGFLEVLDLVKT